MPNIADTRTNIAESLGITVGSELSTAQIDNSISKAASDLSRYYPQELVVEHVIDIAITAEGFTSSHGTAVSLNEKAITPNSETVENSGQTITYVRGDDYDMDYINGTVKAHSSGDMVNSAAHKITYRRDQLTVDITGLLTNVLTVLEVERVVENAPRDFYDFVEFGNFLYINSIGLRSQGKLADQSYIRIWYHAKQDDPGSSSNGTWPRFLDEILEQGASAYCLLIRSQQEQEQAVIDLNSGRTVIASADDDLALMDTQFASSITALTAAAASLAKMDGSSGDPIDDAETALAKVATHAGTEADSAFDKVNVDLDSATNDARTKIDTVYTELALANTALDTVATELQSATENANKYLADGDAFLNTVNTGGPNVPRDYVQFAQAKINMAVSYAQEAQQRVAHGNAIIQAVHERVLIASSWVAEGQGRVSMANAFIGEANARGILAAQYASQAAAYIQEAAAHLGAIAGHLDLGRLYLNMVDRYHVNATSSQSTADLFRLEAKRRMDYFHAVLADRQQTHGTHFIAARRQWNNSATTRP
jgi:hypothetical protein